MKAVAGAADGGGGCSGTAVTRQHTLAVTVAEAVPRERRFRDSERLGRIIDRDRDRIAPRAIALTPPPDLRRKRLEAMTSSLPQGPTLS